MNNETISVSEARQIIEITNNLVKTLALTKSEMVELMLVYDKVIDRLIKENEINE